MVEDGVCVNSFGGLRSRFSFWDLRQRSTSQICEIGLNLGLDSTGKEGSKFWNVAEIQSDLLLRRERMSSEKRQYSQVLAGYPAKQDIWRSVFTMYFRGLTLVGRISYKG